MGAFELCVPHSCAAEMVGVPLRFADDEVVGSVRPAVLEVLASDLLSHSVVDINR